VKGSPLTITIKPEYLFPGDVSGAEKITHATVNAVSFVALKPLLQTSTNHFIPLFTGFVWLSVYFLIS